MPPVDVMRTVEAVMAPVLLDGPNAVTQSPTARAVDEVDWVAESVVDELVVILSFCVLGLVCLVEGFAVGRVKSELRSVPDSETVDPVTAVTLPLAMARLAAPANDLRAPDPAPVPLLPRPGKLPLGGVKPAWDPVPAPAPVPPNRPRAAPPPKPPVHAPVEEAWLMVIDRAAMVVLDFFDFVPVTVRQSPTATALTVSVAVSLNVVDPVHDTDVCPAVALCTSIVVPAIEATSPLALPVGVVAAPATLDNPRTTDRLNRTVAGAIHLLGPVWVLAVLAMVILFSLITTRSTSFDSCSTHSLLRASMGAKLAARLAG